MTREEFAALPPMLALGLIYDVASSRLRELPAPSVPRPPKYDDRFPKKKGFFVWVSEMTFDDLVWWRGKKAESAEGGGEWAEKDGKWVVKLDKWIEWRRLFPSEVWFGTRGDERATAASPCREPALHAWGDRKNGSAGAKPETKRGPSPDDDGRVEEEEGHGF